MNRASAAGIYDGVGSGGEFATGLGMAAASMDDQDDDSATEDPRGRELALPAKDNKQVRVVSPPRDKEEKKPIKGILRQPKPQFPEEPDPIEERVAPLRRSRSLLSREVRGGIRLLYR